MTPSEYKALEGNKKFKRYYMGKTLWWKSFLFFAPACLLFIGMAGIMHMGYNDNLWSWYAAPYIAVFMLGTIWLKGIKKHVQAKMLNDKERYLVCASRMIGDKGGRYYFIFSKDSKRHNESLIHKLAEKVSVNSLSEEQLRLAKKQILEININGEESTMYLLGIDINKVLKANKQNLEEGIIPLIYITQKDTFVVRYKDLK